MVSTCPVSIKGVSTGRAPIHVNRITRAMKVQKVVWFK